MPRAIFVNLPVADVVRSTDFYRALGFEQDTRFSNEQASAMIWSDTISVMLLDRAFYGTFTPKPIIDAHAQSGVLLALAFDSREAVDTFTQAAIAAGGREAHEPEDLGFMYSRGFDDPDGHGWGPFHMDVDAAMAAQSPASPALA